MTYARNFSTKKTSQSAPIPISPQVPNSAGGYVFQISDFQRLSRFLILGNEGGTYYATEQKLTKENANCILTCLEKDSDKTVSTIVEISESGRAPKQEPAIFALALCVVFGDKKARIAALTALSRVCRTGYHLLRFMDNLEQFHIKGQSGGLGRAKHVALQRWFLNKATSDCAYQLMKYKQREGWAMRDVLRLCRPTPPNREWNDVFRWAVKGETNYEVLSVATQVSKSTDPSEVIPLIQKYNLPREVINPECLKSADVWEALLEKMPYIATLRNLATMTRTGLLTPLSNSTQIVLDRLTNENAIRKSRVHPISILSALKVYASGHGIRSQSGNWTPVPQIKDALDSVFYTAFGNVTLTNKRLLIACDISGSMGMGSVAGIPGLRPVDITAALAMVTAKVEPKYMIVGFHTSLIPLEISAKKHLEDVVKYMQSLGFGGTDCAQPMLWALAQRNVSQGPEAFITITDNETWAGNIHPVQALNRYREYSGIAAKLCTVAVTSTGFSISDPNDSGMLDICGCDTATPQVISDFITEN